MNHTLADLLMSLCSLVLLVVLVVSIFRRSIRAGRGEALLTGVPLVVMGVVEATVGLWHAGAVVAAMGACWLVIARRAS